MSVDRSADGPGLKQLEQKLQIRRSQSVAVISAPPESRLKLLAAGQASPDQADVVVGFATRCVDLAWLRPAYAAARAGRMAWVNYPTPGRPGTDLRRDWLIRALRQYGVEPISEVPLDDAWSALLLCPIGGEHPSGHRDARRSSPAPATN